MFMFEDIHQLSGCRHDLQCSDNMARGMHVDYPVIDGCECILEYQGSGAETATSFKVQGADLWNSVPNSGEAFPDIAWNLGGITNSIPDLKKLDRKSYAFVVGEDNRDRHRSEEEMTHRSTAVEIMKNTGS